MSSENYRILILDDDVQIATLLKTFLETCGPFQVDHIIVGADLLPTLAAQTYDLLMLDYQLPDASGLELLKTLNDQNPQGTPIPVIMMSGQGDQHTAAQAIQRGAFEYLVKGEDFLPTLPQLIKKTIHLHELQESSRRLMDEVNYQSFLLENMHDAVVVWNQEGLITYWNNAASLLFGRTPQEMLDQPVQAAYLDLFSPTVNPLHGSDTTPVEIESEYSHPQGKKIWVSSRLMPLHNNGTLLQKTGFMNVSRDITPRKVMQQNLLDTQRFIKKVIDTTPNIVYIFGLDHHFTFVNALIKNLIGYTPEEICGMKAGQILALIHPDDRKVIHRNHQAYLTAADGVIIESELRIRHKNEQWHWLYCRESVFSRDASGAPLQIIGAGEDITERKESEARIRQANTQLMQAARMSAIGQLATGVAHQVSNPLTAILGETQLMLRELTKDDPMRESIEIIETAGWRAQWAVQILNTFSVPPPSTIGSVDLYETIRLALNMVGVNFQSSGVVLKIELNDERPTIRGNPRQMEAFWVNLFIYLNSIIDRPDCTLQITTLNIHPTQIGIGINLCGIIVKEEQLNTIFNAGLAVADSSLSGLEFSICQEILRQNQGSIEIESGNNQTDFRVILPKEQVIPSNS